MAVAALAQLACELKKLNTSGTSVVVSVDVVSGGRVLEYSSKEFALSHQSDGVETAGASGY